MTIWLILIIVSMIVEIVTLDLVSIWLSVGALFALFAEMLGFNLTIQITTCVIVTALTAFLIRPLSKKYLAGNIVHTNADRVIGKHGVVTKQISADNIGEIKVLGGYWSARSVNENDTILVNDRVEVLAIEGVKLIVKKI